MKQMTSIFHYKNKHGPTHHILSGVCYIPQSSELNEVASVITPALPDLYKGG